MNSTAAPATRRSRWSGSGTTTRTTSSGRSPQRPGFLRLTTGRVDADFLSARNTLTQRTFGPECSGTTAIDVSNMKDGDFAGLALLQKQYGLVGVKMAGGTKLHRHGERRIRLARRGAARAADPGRPST